MAICEASPLIAIHGALIIQARLLTSLILFDGLLLRSLTSLFLILTVTYSFTFECGIRVRIRREFWLSTWFRMGFYCDEISGKLRFKMEFFTLIFGLCLTLLFYDFT